MATASRDSPKTIPCRRRRPMCRLPHLCRPLMSIYIVSRYLSQSGHAYAYTELAINQSSTVQKEPHLRSRSRGSSHLPVASGVWEHVLTPTPDHQAWETMGNNDIDGLATTNTQVFYSVGWSSAVSSACSSTFCQLESGLYSVQLLAWASVFFPRSF
jgi:hypothetical protein